MLIGVLGGPMVAVYLVGATLPFASATVRSSFAVKCNFDFVTSFPLSVSYAAMVVVKHCHRHAAVSCDRHVAVMFVIQSAVFGTLLSAVVGMSL